MTYALAWKTEKQVFLAADTAITTTGSGELTFSQSSFGEQHVVNPNSTVEERMLKIFSKYNIGIVLAGNTRVAVQVIQDFYSRIELGIEPDQALLWSLGMNPEVLEKEKSIAIIIGFYSNGSPQLLSYNSNHDHAIRMDEELVQVGSIPDNFKQETSEWLGIIVPPTADRPNEQLALMLGIFQTYTLFNNLLNEGVGGAFAGMYVAADGVHWQPDILFDKDKQALIGTCFREDCFIVNSPTFGQSRCLLSYVPPRSNADLLNQANAGVAAGKDVQNQARFDYVVFINTNNRTLTVVIMQKNRRHELLWLEPMSNSSGRGTTMAIFPQLNEMIQDNRKLKVVIYKPPKTDTIPEDKKRIQTLNPNLPSDH